MSKRILGIDGGGTKTSFLLADMETQRVYAHTAKDCCHFHHGIEGFTSRIKNGIDTVLKEACIAYGDVMAVCAGLSSFGESKQEDDVICSIMRSFFKTPHILVVNDVEVSLAGSLELRPGITIVAGTGSMALGKNRFGRTARSGGWGEIIGDEGSAYWLGRKALELFSKQADGRLIKGALYEILSRALGLSDCMDLIEYTYKSIGNERDRIAALSPLLFEAAQGGDAEALNVFEKAAEELFAMVKAVAERLSFERDIEVSYSGGVFKAGCFILDPFISLLSKLNAHLEKPQLTPISGAALLAGEMLGEKKALAKLLHKYEESKNFR